VKVDHPDDFVAGCYANLVATTGESFKGLLLRLAEANQYTGIADLLASTLGINRAALSASRDPALKVAMDAALLAQLGRAASGRADALKAYAAQEISEKAFSMHGSRIDRDAWLGSTAQVCPQCLAQFGIAFEDWDFSPVVACQRHQLALVDTCQGCGERLSWTRPRLLFCGGCGADLRSLQAPSTSSACVTASADFAALAPFRIEVEERLVRTIEWDEAFRVMKALCLRPVHYRDGFWPESTYFSRLSVAARLQVVSQFGQCRHDDSYHLTYLRAGVLSAVAPVRAVPKFGVEADIAFELLFRHGVLSRDVAGALTSRQAAAPPVSGASRFAGRPPTLHRRVDVEQFLAIDSATFDGLLRRQIIELPVAEEGFDIDQLLRAQDYVANELLGYADLERIVGLPLDWEDLAQCELFPPWNGPRSMDRRVDLRTLCALQLTLWDAVLRARPPVDPVRLGFMAGNASRPFMAASVLVDLVRHGGLQALRWHEPYTWIALELDAGEVERISDPRVRALLEPSMLPRPGKGTE
jgi:TniQ